MTIFASMRPEKDDSIQSFARRLRNAFFRLSRADRTSTTIRSMITDICSRYLPRVWSLIELSLNRLRNDQRVEKVVQIAERVSRWDTEEKNFISDPQMSTMLSLPTSSNDTNLNLVSEKNTDPAYVNNSDVCFQCNKSGD